VKPARTSLRNHRALFGGLALLLLFVGGLLRFTALEQRPMHTDEAVHAVKLGTMLESGEYVYDPQDYHGPTLYYLTLPVLWGRGVDALREMDAGMLRVVPAVVGLLLVALVLGLADGIGRRAAVYAGLFTAVSPALVFYSRYYIQEELLVLLSLAAIACGWRFAQTRTWRWALATGACFGLMHATKETAVLAWAAMAGGLLLTAFWSQRRDTAPLNLRAAIPARMVLASAGAGLLLSALLVSAFFRHPAAILDSWLTYAQYFERSGGAGLHDHPWHYYFEMLLYTRNAPGPWWSEGLIVALALVGIAFALGERDTHPGHLRRFLAFYTVLLMAIYALIPYKTPWCMLGFLNGMTLLAGIGVDGLLRRTPSHGLRAVVLALVAVGTLHLGQQALRTTSARYDADTRNPYVYGHTSGDAERLGQRVEALAALHKDGDRMTVKVMAPEYWPLPWYLRTLDRVGYWDALPADPEAPVMIVAPDFAPKLTGRYHEEYYGLRPEVLVMLYVDEALWGAYMDAQVTR
jgi:uncharacterized protein (TIGR03663 family)